MKPDVAIASAPVRPRVQSVRLPSDRWALGIGLRETVRQFRFGWITLPRTSKLKSAVVLGGGLLGCLVFSVALTFLGKWWGPRGLDGWDGRLLQAIENQTILSVQNAILLESFGNLVYLVPLTAACAVVAARRRKPMLAITFVAAYLLARPIVLVGWLVWNRTRPTLILDGRAAPPLHSFPSGHVVLAISVYGLLAYLWVCASKSWFERAIAVVSAIAIVLVTGFSRVRLGTHWPSDVIAGWLIGIAWLAVVIAAYRASRESV